MRRLIVCAFAALSIASSATAVPPCGPWIPNTNGTSWRMCTDAQGERYCELDVGSKIKRITCP